MTDQLISQVIAKVVPDNTVQAVLLTYPPVVSKVMPTHAVRLGTISDNVDVAASSRATLQPMFSKSEVEAMILETRRHVVKEVATQIANVGDGVADDTLRSVYHDISEGILQMDDNYRLYLERVREASEKVATSLVQDIDETMSSV